MRSTYWKLSAVSTKVRTSKSGGMGSKEALGRAAGIFAKNNAHIRREIPVVLRSGKG